MAHQYDTLDAVDTNGASDIADAYALVVGEAMDAPDLCGVITSGPLNQSYSHGGYWGRYPLSFKGHPEVWYMRCAPVGRIGKPLERGEVRKISVLVRESETSKNSIVTNIKLWRRPLAEEMLTDRLDIRKRTRGWATLGPIGVATHGIRMFERRITDNAQVTLPAIATVTRTADGVTLRRIEPMMMMHYVLASSMIGMGLHDPPKPRMCEICYTEAEYDSACTRSAATFRRMCADHMPSLKGEDIVSLMASAEDVCEQESFIGYLDQRADPFYIGAMQDDMHKPSGMPLILAIAVCIASNSEQWGLPAIRSDDAFATQEARFFIESTLPTIVSMDAGAKKTGRGQVHSIDVILNYALANIKLCLSKVESGSVLAMASDSKSPYSVDAKKINNALKASLSYLMCTGISVCVDLFGLPPKRSSGLDGAYNAYGFAQHLVDPVMASRVQSAHDKGLGNTVPRWKTLRTSTRGRRQLALASVLVEVDAWLRTGKYKGVVLQPTSEASESVRPDELDPTRVPATPAMPTMPTTTTSASAASARSSKKKHKKPEALLAERGKQREARQHGYAFDAVRCMIRPGGKEDWKVPEAAQKLCGESVQAAAAIVSDLLQGLEHGVCVGIGDLFQMCTHLVGPASKVQCANCENTVDVVESVAFSGALGACPGCGHPRCLECVSADIATFAAGGTFKHGQCKHCKAHTDSYY
jgi:hypothetical protein